MAKRSRLKKAFYEELLTKPLLPYIDNAITNFSNDNGVDLDYAFDYLDKIIYDETGKNMSEFCNLLEQEMEDKLVHHQVKKLNLDSDNYHFND